MVAIMIEVWVSVCSAGHIAGGAAAGTVAVVTCWTVLEVEGVPTRIVNKCAVVAAGIGIGSVAVAVAAAAAFDDGVGIEGVGSDDDVGCIVENAVAVAVVVVVAQYAVLGFEIVPAWVMLEAVVIAGAEAAGLVCVVAEAAAVVSDAGGDTVVMCNLAFDAAFRVVVVVAGCLHFLVLCYWVRIAITWACGIGLILCSAVI